MNKEILDNLLKRIYRVVYASVMPDKEKVNSIKNILREYKED